MAAASPSAGAAQARHRRPYQLLPRCSSPQSEAGHPPTHPLIHPATPKEIDRESPVPPSSPPPRPFLQHNRVPLIDGLTWPVCLHACLPASSSVSGPPQQAAPPSRHERHHHTHVHPGRLVQHTTPTSQPVDRAGGRHIEYGDCDAVIVMVMMINTKL